MLYNKEYCKKHKVRYSSSKEEVYTCIANAKKPLTAYDIIYEMGIIEQKNVKPTTVYRAVDFLLEQNLIHKIDSLKAYMVCQHNHLHEGVCFIICQTCKNVYENPEYGFKPNFNNELKDLDIQHWQLEVKVKKCRKCA